MLNSVVSVNWKKGETWTLFDRTNSIASGKSWFLGDSAAVESTSIHLRHRACIDCRAKLLFLEFEECWPSFDLRAFATFIFVATVVCSAGVPLFLKPSATWFIGFRLDLWISEPGSAMDSSSCFFFSVLFCFTTYGLFICFEKFVFCWLISGVRKGSVSFSCNYWSFIGIGWKLIRFISVCYVFLFYLKKNSMFPNS